MGVRQILPHHWDSASNLDVFAASGFLRMPALRRLRGDKVKGGSTFHDQRLTLVPSQRGHETDPLSVGGVFSVPWSVAVAAHLPE
jgi:hypothetical protein